MYLKTNYKSVFPQILLALVGVAIVFLVTPHGVGISPDSIAYIKGGRSLLEHGSVNGLPTHWPPGYPILLALFSIPNGDYLTAARFINVLVFGMNIFLFSALLQKSGWDRLYASLLAALLIFDPDFLNVHLMAWSEPSFLLLMLAGLLAFLAYAESKSTKYLYVAGIAFGMSVIVRYAGMSLIFCVALILLFQCMEQKSDERLLVRLRPLLQFLSIALLPISLWIVSKLSAAREGGIRSAMFHAMTADKWHEGLNTIGRWFGGPEVGLALLAIIVMLLVFGMKNMSVGAKRVLVFAGALLVSYCSFILVSLFFFDAAIPLDQRILSPAKLLINLIVFVSLHAVVVRWRPISVGILAGLALLLNYQAARSSMYFSSQVGVGFASVKLKNQPIFSFIGVNHIAVDATNSPELAFLYLNQEVPMLPALFDPVNRVPVAGYASELANLAQPRNTVVFFAASQPRDYLPTVQQLMNAGFVNVVYQQPDGIILQHP
jgi:hypothetical protein